MKHTAFLLVLFLFAACSGTENPGSDTTTENNNQNPNSPKDSIHRIKLVFVGDIMGHGNQIQSAAGSKEKEKSKNMNDFNYEPCFRYVKPILEKADLAIGNLELTLSNKGKYSGYPMFKTPDALATYLQNAGFDILTTCNNHSNDNGLYGIEHTLDVLDSLKIVHTGTFRNQAEREKTYPLIVEKQVDGTIFRLAFINYTYGTNGLATPAPTVVNLIEQGQMAKDIELAKAAKPDMIIAIMHWGEEYWLNEGPYQANHAKFLWENGVDVVIGAHPHVVEPIKTATLWNQDSTEKREVLVAYSLGNFISNQYQPNTDIGLIFELELVKNSKTNKTTIGEHDYILGWRYIYGRSDSKKKAGYDWTYTVVPVTAFENDYKTQLNMTDNEIKALKEVSERTRKNLGKWQSKERKVSLAELGTVKAIDASAELSVQ